MTLVRDGPDSAVEYYRGVLAAEPKPKVPTIRFCQQRSPNSKILGEAHKPSSEKTIWRQRRDHYRAHQILRGRPSLPSSLALAPKQKAPKPPTVSRNQI